jgi:hypothetical protein
MQDHLDAAALARYARLMAEVAQARRMLAALAQWQDAHLRQN